MTAEFPTLADVVAKHADSWQYSWESFGAHVQDEWLKARTITTVEDLEALPDKSVVHMVNARTASAIEKESGVWWVPMGTRCVPVDRLQQLLPAIVIWHPDWSDQ